MPDEASRSTPLDPASGGVDRLHTLWSEPKYALAGLAENDASENAEGSGLPPEASENTAGSAPPSSCIAA